MVRLRLGVGRDVPEMLMDQTISRHRADRVDLSRAALRLN
jgi:hypothetical protein